MNFLIHCLLISGLSVLVNGDEEDLVPNIMREAVNAYFKNEEYKNYFNSLTGSNAHRLKLVKDRQLGRSAKSLVWQGVYNDNQDVAIKILWDKKAMDTEMAVYNALNAVDDPNIEDNNIPRVYYYGKFLGEFYAIAMSLFDGSLTDYYNRFKKNVSDLDILYIFLQTVKGLKYLSTKNVVHNDIKPDNLFYGGRNIFIGDFDLATLNGAQSLACTPLFASANFFANKSRHAMDDLESLVYSLWFLARVPLDSCEDHEIFGDFVPEGCALFESLYQNQGKKEARSRLMKKIEHFKNTHVRGVFEDVWDKELLSNHTVPNFGGINHILIYAIGSVNKNRGLLQGDWLSDGLCSSFKKIASICNR